eukprot:TRINITY_DN778_c0_g2_i1.p1 TRINITY_DN778_c0_g2~~TRINITY_DN778_c0_g2_i1.p1  ORF type:complete len:215 (+),score=15.80 TRINITY_DN778_c0_g2_i1:62-646(+)
MGGNLSKYEENTIYEGIICFLEYNGRMCFEPIKMMIEYAGQMNVAKILGVMKDFLLNQTAYFYAHPILAFKFIVISFVIVGAINAIRSTFLRTVHRALEDLTAIWSDRRLAVLDQIGQTLLVVTGSFFKLVKSFVWELAVAMVSPFMVLPDLFLRFMNKCWAVLGPLINNLDPIRILSVVRETEEQALVVLHID